jgi:thiol-disulfide isomerase/thioredoxin
MPGTEITVRNRTWLGVVLLLAAAAALAAPQAKAPRDPELIDEQGYKQLLEKYRGKALLVNFWATWCEPCRDEYPLLNQLAKQYAPKGLHVVGVSLDDDGEMILVRRFLARHQPVFPNYRKRAGKNDEFVRAVNAAWNGSLPASFFYAADGRQIGHYFGAGDRETFEAAIRTLLASGSNGGPNDKPSH